MRLIPLQQSFVVAIRRLGNVTAAAYISDRHVIDVAFPLVRRKGDSCHAAPAQVCRKTHVAGRLAALATSGYSPTATMAGMALVDGGEHRGMIGHASRALCDRSVQGG